jgi:drug/metabolite transporter (DMT)-like permease
VSARTTLSPTTDAAGAPPSSAPAPSSLAVWSALWVCYVVWGSTYFAIRVMVETMPALLGAGVRFTVAGAVMLGVLAAMGRRVRLERAHVGGALVVGTLFMGANGVVMLAEKEVPSAVAALVIASIPLWVIVLRRLGGERPARRSFAAVAVGFAGVALLLAPGEQHEGASALALLALVGAAVMWATATVRSPRTPLPRDLLVSSAWQMLLGGAVCILVALAIGEGTGIDPSAFSTESVLAFAYLVVFGSWLAFSAFAWLLQNAPVSKVATYAYVNPVIAIALGALILDEVITPATAVGAAIIVVSVALVIRTESPARRQLG